MKKQFTPAQQQAIDAVGSVLVNASAGTGKTTVLTERTVQLIIKNRQDIRRLVLLTFSNAAAAEMKERTKARLMKELERDDLVSTDRRFLQNQLRNFGFANIQTIHSFCGDIIRQNSYMVGLSPDFEIANEFTNTSIRREAMKEVIEKASLSNSTAFKNLTHIVGGFDEIVDQMLYLVDSLSSIPNGIDWYRGQVETYKIKQGEIPKFFTDMMISDLDIAIDRYAQVVELSRTIETEDKSIARKIENLTLELDSLVAMKNAVVAGNTSFINATNLLQLKTRLVFKQDCAELKEMRDVARKPIVEKYIDSSFDLIKQLERMPLMYDTLLLTYELMVDYLSAFVKAKKERNIVDFNDLEKFALQIVQNPEVANMYKSQFDHILIDEFQDTNEIQDSILRAVSRENNVFTVGDLKQSIYRFRSSDPLLFMKRNNNYRSGIEQGQVIELSNNFRSSTNVIDATNDIFRKLSGYSNEISYTTKEELINSRPANGTDDEVELCLLTSEVLAESKVASAKELEVMNVANYIKNIIGKPVYDPSIGEYRPTTYADIAILCRKISSKASLFTEVFSKLDIPFVIDKAGKLYETVEVQVLLNLLMLIKSFDDDIAAISVIHFGLFSFNDQDLIDIRLHDSNNTLTQNIKDLAAMANSPVAIKCLEFISFIEKYRSQSSVLKVSEIVSSIILELDYTDYFIGQNGGGKKVDNINLFQKSIIDFDKIESSGISGFIRYIEDVMNGKLVVDEAPVAVSSDAVLITTIHKSKGLEYPVVILPFMGDAFSNIDQLKPILVSKDEGIGIDFYDANNKEKAETLLRKYISSVVVDKNREEELRLLYVAMTRAKEKLMIQGFKKSNVSNDPLNIKSMLEWILIHMFDINKDEHGIISYKPKNIESKWKLIEPNYQEVQQILMDKSEVDSHGRFNMYHVDDIQVEKKRASFKETPSSMPASHIVSFTELSVDVLERLDITKADMGNTYHKFMTQISFEKLKNGSSVQEEILRLSDLGILTNEEIEIIDAQKIENFLKTEIGQKMLQSTRQFRETNIPVLKAASEYGYDDDSEILIKCIIDIVFEYEDEWYIVDYKTDFIKNPNDKYEVASKVAHHRPQIEVYGEAFAKTFGKKVKESHLAFITAGIVEKV